MDRYPGRGLLTAMRLSIGVLLGLLIVAAACARAPAIPEVTFNAEDFSFQGPDTVSAGLVRVKMTNVGQEPHHLQFLRLNDGVSLEQFQAALQQGPEAALPLVTLPGGPAAIGPNDSVEAILDLSVGQYVLACFIPSPDGVPHLAKGMIKPLQVTAAAGARPKEPRVAGTIRMNDFAFEMKDTLPAGKAIFKVVNDGPQPHEMGILRLQEGKSAEDVVLFFRQPSGPPPFEFVGGMQGMSNGTTAFLVADLEPGSYLATCEIPDPVSGKPHSELGMTKEFQVR